VGREGLRKAVAGILAFIIGISIAVVTIIPLLIYLNTSSGETIRAFNTLRDFQAQKSSESIGIALEGGGWAIKNTGSVSETIVLAVIDTGNGCNNGTALIRTSITLNPGDRIYSINISTSSYSLDKICYVVTARGNVFPVKEKYLAALASQQSQNLLFTPNNVKFAEDLMGIKDKIKANYSTDDLSCNKNGRVYFANALKNYKPMNNAKILTISDRNNNIVTYGSKDNNNKNNKNNEGCFSVTFPGILNITSGSYGLVIYYRIILDLVSKSKSDNPGSSSADKMSVNVSISVMGGGIVRASMASVSSWSLNSIDLDYIVLENYLLIPLKGVNPGIYDLNVTVLFPTLQGNTQVQVGIEYIAVQGATLVT